MEHKGKWIERFAHVNESKNAAAGVYRVTDSATIAGRTFPTVIKELRPSFFNGDAGTNQAFDARGVFETNHNSANDNPGISSSDLGNFKVAILSGVPSSLPVYIYFPQGATMTLTWDINLFGVTANAISFIFFCTIRYLCPEDYLNMEAFASVPE